MMLGGTLPSGSVTVVSFQAFVVSIPEGPFEQTGLHIGVYLPRELSPGEGSTGPCNKKGLQTVTKPDGQFVGPLEEIAVRRTGSGAYMKTGAREE